MIVLVTGVSGSGKTTVGSLLAGRLGWAFEDGDVLHPAANIAKMRAGIPLTDADRWPWLRLVGEWMDAEEAAGRPAVVACSALKRSYRDLLRAGRPWLRLVLLHGDRDLLASRLAARHGHFFDPDLLASQLADLELPQPDEDVLMLSIADPPGVMAGEIMSRLRLAPASGPSPPGGSPAPGGQARGGFPAPGSAPPGAPPPGAPPPAAPPPGAPPPAAPPPGAPSPGASPHGSPARGDLP